MDRRIFSETKGQVASEDTDCRLLSYKVITEEYFDKPEEFSYTCSTSSEPIYNYKQYMKLTSPEYQLCSILREDNLERYDQSKNAETRTVRFKDVAEVHTFDIESQDQSSLQSIKKFSTWWCPFPNIFSNGLLSKCF